jgi:hypothetical protein
MIKKVYLVFKTHLDIGFTDFAKNIVDQYCNSYIPKAIRVAKELRERGGKEKLCWTTGSWLTDTYLARATSEEKEEFEKAIERKDISWHSLAFTTHTETMSERLFQYDLSIARKLDAAYGHHTIAAKMTDVPGHTIAMVPLLAKQGIRFLHIGVNQASKVPSVPPLFRWKAPSGEEIIVRYDAAYGACFEPKGIPYVLDIENSSDNSGPPCAEEVIAIYQKLAKDYPDAEIIPDDLTGFANAILPYADKLPVITNEIGDTWIHGTGTDPKKMAEYRALLRLADENNLDPNDTQNHDFFSHLIMVPEHTWGMDIKKYLGDWHSWSIEDFQKARKRDIVDDSKNPKETQESTVCAKREFLSLFPDGEKRWEQRRYSIFDKSHEEQREYVTDAFNALSPDLKQEALLIFPRRASILEGDKVMQGESVRIGNFTVVFGKSGAMTSLKYHEKEYLNPKTGLGLLSYETFSNDDFDRWTRQYNRNMEENKNWAYADFSKPGLYLAHPKHEVRYMQQFHITVQGNMIQVILKDSTRKLTGCPRMFSMTYTFSSDDTMELSCSWKDKTATRLPEAIWLSMGFAVDKALWRMRKLGSLLDYTKTQSGGNHRLHAVEEIVHPALSVTPIDSMLVSLGTRYLGKYANYPASYTNTYHWNLYNNIWGTNFPVWYEEDATFRFRLAFRGAAAQGRTNKS